MKVAIQQLQHLFQAFLSSDTIKLQFEEPQLLIFIIILQIISQQ